MILVRALVYGSAFVAFVLLFLPARVLEWSGVSPCRPLDAGPVRLLGG